MNDCNNLRAIRARIDAAAISVARKPEDITLIAVAKYSELDSVVPLVDCGVVHFAENVVQNAQRWHDYEKRDRIKLHMIGHLQRNKVGKALEIFNSIDTVDSRRLAERIINLATRPIDVMIEVNISGESNKTGCSVSDIEPIVEIITNSDIVKLCGVFTMCPIDATEQNRENIYLKASDIASELELRLGRKIERSFGMSDDFELAIRCGASQVRIGRALFGG